MMSGGLPENASLPSAEIYNPYQTIIESEKNINVKLRRMS
jgi:hypothetical protein